MITVFSTNTRGTTNFFFLGHEANAPIVHAPMQKWDGDFNNTKPQCQTWVNLEAIGDLVERIYKDLQQLASANQLDIELAGGLEELITRYIFKTKVKVK